jgi:hypothetical protein
MVARAKDKAMAPIAATASRSANHRTNPFEGTCWVHRANRWGPIQEIKALSCHSPPDLRILFPANCWLAMVRSGRTAQMFRKIEHNLP